MKEIKLKNKSYNVNMKNNIKKSKKFRILLQQRNKKKMSILLIRNNIKLKSVKS
jgi:hypothetical protein